MFGLFYRYLASNQIAPQFENIELNIGDFVLKKALQEATGRPMKLINKSLKEKGDLGFVAEASKKSIRTLYQPPPLTVRHVFKKFKEISRITGAKSGAKKGGIVKSLLAAGSESLTWLKIFNLHSTHSYLYTCMLGSGLEGRFIVRALQGKMRINMVRVNWAQLECAINLFIYFLLSCVG